MSQFHSILERMAEQIRNVTEAGTDWDVQVEAGMIGTPTPPTVDVFPGDPVRSPDGLAAYGELAGAYVVVVRARADALDNLGNQDVLVSFMSDDDPLCIAAAIMDEPTLNGYASSIRFDAMTGYLLEPMGGVELLGVRWTFSVLPAVS